MKNDKIIDWRDLNKGLEGLSYWEQVIVRKAFFWSINIGLSVDSYVLPHMMMP